MDISNKIKSRNIDEFELVKKRVEKKKVVVKDGKIEDFKNSIETTWTLRIIKSKKLGFTFFTDFNEIDNAIDKAVALAEVNDIDQLNSFYKYDFSEDISSLNLYNEDIKKFSEDKQLDIACNIEEYAYNLDNRINIVKDAGCLKGEYEVTYINSNGVEKFYKSNYIGATVVALAKESNSSMVGYEYFVSKTLDIDEKSIAKSAVNKAVRMLNAKKGKSYNCPIIIENELVGDILTIIAPSFFIENIEKNKSLFTKFKIGDKIASPRISLIDSGINEKYIGSALFDDEGAPTNEKKLLKNGLLNDFLYNYYYAKKNNKNYSGNGFLPGFKSNPVITYTNLILESDRKDALKEIIGNISMGFFLTNLMGLHLADPISGDFSLGAEGILIEKGELTKPVKEVVLTGNIIDILKNCVAVFDDIKVNGSIISPSILVEGLKISGN